MERGGAWILLSVSPLSTCKTGLHLSALDVARTVETVPQQMRRAWHGTRHPGSVSTDVCRRKDQSQCPETRQMWGDTAHLSGSDGRLLQVWREAPGAEPSSFLPPPLLLARLQLLPLKSL